MIKFNYTRTKAKRADLKMEGNVQEYALNFLKIFNTARAYSDCFIKVENNEEDMVYVTYYPDAEKTVVEYLKKFGTITNIYNIRLYVIDMDYNDADFDRMHDLDDTEFIVRE